MSSHILHSPRDRIHDRETHRAAEPAQQHSAENVGGQNIPQFSRFLTSLSNTPLLWLTLWTTMNGRRFTIQFEVSKKNRACPVAVTRVDPSAYKWRYNNLLRHANHQGWSLSSLGNYIVWTLASQTREELHVPFCIYMFHAWLVESLEIRKCLACGEKHF